MEVWLRANRRVVLAVMLVPALALVGSLLIAVFAGRNWIRVTGLVLAVLSAAQIVQLLRQMRRPRMAYRAGELLLWLRGAAPIHVPIEVVECFWLGQAPSLLPGKRHEHTEAAAIVIRLAERAAEWRHQDVRPQLGAWCEGYVTIRGTWCEPLSIDVVNRLNRRLAEVTGRSTVAGSSTG